MMYAHQRLGGPRRPLRVVVLLGVASVLLACSSGPSPDAAAREWLHALYTQDGNTAAKLTCDAEQTSLFEGSAILAVTTIIGEDLIGQSVDVDDSEVRAETISQSGDTATVQMSGTVRIAILGLSQPTEVDETVRMVMESGQWKYCGGSR